MYCINSTLIAVCHPKRAHQHPILKGFISWGKTSVGYFFDTGIHLIVSNLSQMIHILMADRSTCYTNP